MRHSLPLLASALFALTLAPSAYAGDTAGGENLEAPPDTPQAGGGPVRSSNLAPKSDVELGAHIGFAARLTRDQGYAIFTAPMGLDLRYRASRQLTIGALGEAGPLMGLGGMRARGGGDLELHGGPLSRLDPWAGAGAAVVFYRLHAVGTDVVTAHDELGVEPFLTLGFDVRPTRDLRLGVFATASAERFLARTDDARSHVADHDFHPYGATGLRVALDL